MANSKIPFAQIVAQTARFALWRKGLVEPVPIGRTTVLLMSNMLVAVMALAQRIYASDYYWTFEPTGIVCTFGLVGVICISVGNAVRAEHRKPLLAVVLGLLICATIAWVGLAFLSDCFSEDIKSFAGSNARWHVNGAIVALLAIWLIGSIGRALIWIEGQASWGLRVRAVRIVCATVFSFYVFPGVWIFDYYERDPIAYSIWAFLTPPATATDERPTPHSVLRSRLAALELSQSTLLANALGNLQPRSPDVTNLFALGIAGDMMGDEFPRELNSGLGILGKRFATEGHTVKLINHLDFADLYPVASRQNFATAVAGIAQQMDRDNDIFVLFMTSHGSQAGLYLDMGNLAWGALSPETVKAVLDMNGIKNRVILVSACHSGVFVPTLRAPHTAIITAAAADRTSFGCGNENDWTYFGDALFNDGFAQHDNFPEAFYDARRAVTARELREHITPSLPQIDIGDALPQQFPSLFPAAKIERAVSAREQDIMPR